MKRFSFLPILAACGILSASAAFAQKTITPDIPKTISYQGLLSNSDGSQISDGNHRVTVTLYADQFGSEPIWSDTYETTTIGGLFNLYLGSNQPLPGSAEMNRPLWIGTAVNGGQEMRPLTPMSSSPYALNLPDGAVSNAKLADGAVTAEKVDMDYVSSISVNGQKITAKGGELNLRSSDDIRISYDEVSNSLSISKAATSDATTGSEKDGASVLGTGVGNYNAIPANGNTILGATTTTDYSTISGGQNNTVGVGAGYADWSTIGGGVNNTTEVSYGTIAGGKDNTTRSQHDFIGSGENNLIELFSEHSNIVGGEDNIVESPHSSVLGGQTNHIYEDAEFSVITGGVSNTLKPSTRYSFIGSGHTNTIDTYADTSVIVGGYMNMIDAGFGFIGGGRNHKLESGTYNSVITGGDANEIRSNSYGSFIGGGKNNYILGHVDVPSHCQVVYGTIAGGKDNLLAAYGLCGAGFGFIGGGEGNQALHEYSLVVGGKGNTAGSTGGSFGHQVVVGGKDNLVTGTLASILGGQENSAIGDVSAITGGFQNVIDDDYSFIGTGRNNHTYPNATYATIVGGQDNGVSASYSTVVSGQSNTIGSTSPHSVISGGQSNSASTGGWTTIGGGKSNVLSSLGAVTHYSTIGGGESNTIDAQYAVIAGGSENVISGKHGTVGGGIRNTVANGQFGTIGGGYENTVESTESFIGGGRLNAIHDMAHKSAIAGGGWNVIAAGAANSFIGSGTSNLIDGSAIPNPDLINATIPGGDNLIAQSYAQTVIGGWNVAKGTVSSRYSLGGNRNDPIFIIGNGEFTQRSNGFEVSYNGHSIVYDMNGTGATGTGRKAIRGATYTDNVVYAWAQVDPVSTPEEIQICDFGVRGITKVGTGHYTVKLGLEKPEDNGTYSPMKLECGSVTATVIYDPMIDEPNPVCAFIKTTRITNNDIFDIYIFDKNCDHIDLPFTFKVTGRPMQ